MNELPDTAVGLREALRAGDVTAREVAEHFLGRIADHPDLGAFIAVTADQALTEAEAADTRRAELSSDELETPDALPPLHGLPIAHKDLVEVTGATTTYGTAALPHVAAEADHPGVAVLRRAGTISLGKTQVPEFGLNAYSENLVAAPARNPLDPSRTPGGSSGGSAAAVAAGLLPVAPGSDGGGSIRIPALACGLIGLKPSLGTLVSDVVPGAGGDGYKNEFGAPRLAVSGPIARTVADAALLFDAMRGIGAGAKTSVAGRDTGRISSSLDALDTADALGGLRIGISTASPFEAVHPTPVSAEALAVYKTAAHRLAARGHIIEQASFDYDPRYTEVFTSCWMAGLSLIKLAPGAEERLTPFARFYREKALAAPREAHLAAAAELQRIAATLRAEWSRYDVVLTPGLAFAPPLVDAFASQSPEADYRLQCEWTPFTSMVNVSGLPAIAVPLGADGRSATASFSANAPGTPSSGAQGLGVQLIGRSGSETLLLQLAAQLLD